MMLPTPLVPLHDLDDRITTNHPIYAKVEYLHPSGSMKHRSIPPFLHQLLETGELRHGTRIAIRSAGSAAVTTAWTGAQIGCPVVAVLPPTASQQTVRWLQWLGAICHQVPPEEATRLMQEFSDAPDVYVLAQAREERLIDHYRPVAAEILDELPTAAAITVGIGTGLSVTGIGRLVRERDAACRVFGTEPAEAAIASGAEWAPHRIPGLAPPIPQPLLDREVLSGIVPVPSDAAWRRAQRAIQRTGLPLGPSSGATVAAARHLREQGVEGPIVAVCACSIHDYLESSVYSA
jgi:cysteine synthase A